MAIKKAGGRRDAEKKLPAPQSDQSPIYEFPAVTIPPLRGRGDVEIPPEISKREDFTARDLKPALTPARIQVLQKLAARVPAVKKLLGEKFVSIGVRTSEDVKRKSTVTRAMFYSYSNQIAVEAILDKGGRVVGVEDYRYQPAATEEEIRKAVALARRLLHKRSDWSDDLNSGVIAITNDDPTNPEYSRRLMDVRFFKPEERLAQLVAIVDLDKGKVTRSGFVPGEGEER